MSANKDMFGHLQRLGKAVMLPVSVLPVAGILLGVGSSGFSWIPVWLSVLMAKCGLAIFANLPLLFAIGVAIGLAAGDGVAALAATVGYFVLQATLRVVSQLRGLVPDDPAIKEHHTQMAELLTEKAGILVRTDDITLAVNKGVVDTGVFGGILVGIVAAVMFNRYFKIQLPPYLGFFAGKRFVPIATGFACMAMGVVLAFCWAPVGSAISAFSEWATKGNTTLAVFIYGFVERSLIPFGLHHIWNVPFYFEMGSFEHAEGVARGDISRFMAGDPTAGILGGGYLFKMWGLPAAALAMWHSAKPERRAQVGGIMISAALTSFLTGITEPIEFSFMFVAPLLYLFHAFLAGTAFMVFNLAGGLIGTSFSHGMIDLIILWNKATNPSLVILLGLLYSGIYYVSFRFLIQKFDIKTPGREDEVLEDIGDASGGAFARQLVLAFGGRSNITALDACITRLRISVAEPKLASVVKLKALGASGVVTVGNSLQAIFGPLSENLKTDMEQYLKSAGDDADLTEAEKEALRSGKEIESVGADKKVAADPKAGEKAEAWVKALGGMDNIKEMSVCAVTRVRVVVKSADKVDKLKLESEGVDAVMSLADGVYHLIVGPGSEHYLRAMKKVS